MGRNAITAVLFSAVSGKTEEVSSTMPPFFYSTQGGKSQSGDIRRMMALSRAAPPHDWPAGGTVAANGVCTSLTRTADNFD